MTSLCFIALCSSKVSHSTLHVVLHFFLFFTSFWCARGKIRQKRRKKCEIQILTSSTSSQIKKYKAWHGQVSRRDVYWYSILLFTAIFYLIDCVDCHFLLVLFWFVSCQKINIPLQENQSTKYFFSATFLPLHKTIRPDKKNEKKKKRPWAKPVYYPYCK